MAEKYYKGLSLAILSETKKMRYSLIIINEKRILALSEYMIAVVIRF